MTLYPWLEPTWQTLRQRVLAGTLPHALLLYGEDGLGKVQLAQALAHYLVCECGVFEQQTKNQHLWHSEAGHPDCLHLVPEGKLAMIKVDTVREVIHFVSQTAHSESYRVVLIEQAERMNIAAANALLKVLEEPGERCCFILISSHSEQVLPTIRSRCQLANVVADSQQQVLEWLTLQGVAQASEKLAIAKTPLTVMQWQASGWFAVYENLHKALKQHQEPTVVAKQFVDQAPLSMLLSWMIDCLSEILRSQPQRLSQLQPLLAQYYQAYQDTLKPISFNAQLQLEAWLISWYQQVTCR